MNLSQKNPIEIGPNPLKLEEVHDIAIQRRTCGLSSDPDWTQRVKNSHTRFVKFLNEGGAVYGVNTGFGNSCTVAVRDSLIKELPAHLTRFHGCGMGPPFNPEETRAILVARLLSLAAGYSGVRMELLEKMIALLHADILPVIPSEGSVGASGDLTPLSYVAAVLMGEREVWFRGRKVPASEAYAATGLTPISLLPKESLALMNGTAVMTGLASLGLIRAEYLLRLATRVTAMAAIAMKANRAHFAPELFAAKPYPGQASVASRIHKELICSSPSGKPDHIQDRYSIRCAPHVLGVLADALTWMRPWVEIELNSANDNPIIDPETGGVFHGGHFYGGHIAFVMDCLKTAVANIADLIDRQIALLVDTNYNYGLPANLSGAVGARSCINHGFKALQISSSAWTAEALKLTMPASVFSRSTECHNQDKVSMGTISARDAVRVMELVEQVLAVGMMAASQAIHLRKRDTPMDLNPGILTFLADIAEVFPFLEEDRQLDDTLRVLCSYIQQQRWELPL